MKKVDAFEMNIWRWIATVIVLGMIWGLTSCSTVKKDTRKVYKVHYRNPLVLAKYCSETYPCKDSVHYQTEYIQGEDLVFTDTLYEYTHGVDTVYLTKYITKTVKQIDTLRDTKYIQQTDKAAIRVCEADKKTAQDALVIMTDSRDVWRLCGIISSALVMCWIIYKLVRLYFKKKIPL